MKAAGFALGVSALVAGAGPAALLSILGLEPGQKLIENIVATAPLSLGAGLVLIVWSSYKDSLNAYAALTLLGIVAYGSVLLGAGLGHITAAQAAELSRAPTVGGPLGSLELALRATGIFFTAYGAPKFATAFGAAGF